MTGDHRGGALSDERVVEAARRLREAERSGVACPPIRGLLRSGDVHEAYRVQVTNRNLRVASGGRVVGWKVGLTSPVVQQQLGVEEPDFGALFDDRAFEDDQPMDTRGHRLIQPKLEAEVAFFLGETLPDGPVTVDDVRRATVAVAPAIEVVDSRIAEWDIDILDTVADNASTGVFVVGSHPRPLTGLDLRSVEMTMTCGGEVVSSGRGTACLGDPVNSVVWLANTLRELGERLEAGSVILSGALGPMVPVQDGATYEASLGSLGSVRARFV